VHVVAGSRDAIGRSYRDGLAVIHRVPQPQMPVTGFEESSYWLAYSALAAKKISELHADIHFDVMQFAEYGGEGFIYQTDNFAYRDCRYVVQIHGPLGMFAEQSGWPVVGSISHQIGCFLERTVIHHCDQVLASSHNSARFCAEHYDYPLSRIDTIHSGIDTDLFRPRHDIHRPSDGPKLLFAGKLTAIKGFDLVIETVLRMLPKYPNLELRLLGRGNDEHVNKARRRIAAAKAEKNIQIVGYLPYTELPQYYAWCDVFVAPSDHEPGPGNIYLEAMSCQKPVIACNSGGAPEVVLDEQTGLLVPPQDTSALERAICRLIEDRKLCSELGRNGRDWVVENFTIARFIDKIEQHYYQLLDTAAKEPSGLSRLSPTMRA
jgi:glycosyltransferase involved in cell wall biosynthesis